MSTEPSPEPPAELRGKRVLLRPYRREDAPEVFAAINESRDRIKVWLPWAEDGHRSLADTEEFIQRVEGEWRDQIQYVLGMWDVESGRFVGGSGLHYRDPAVPYYEIGYWTREGEVGKGYVREAVQLQAACAFETLNANRVEIRCDARNVRSKRVPESLGFLLEGRLRNQARHTDGSLRDTLIFSLTPDDYARVKGDWS